MGQYDNAVVGEVNICFKRMSAYIYGTFERSHGVFREFSLVAPVSNGLRHATPIFQCNCTGPASFDIDQRPIHGT